MTDDVVTENYNKFLLEIKQKYKDTTINGERLYVIYRYFLSILRVAHWRTVFRINIIGIL